MIQVQELIENGTRYDLVEIYKGDELVGTTGELRMVQYYLDGAEVTNLMIVPEFTDDGDYTGRTLILIDIA